MVTWAQQQASLLRRMVAGERVNDQVDWEKVVEEIEDVGGRERDKVTDALIRAMRHKLCLLGRPHSVAVHRWEAEVQDPSRRGAAPILQQYAPVTSHWRVGRRLPERAA